MERLPNELQVSQWSPQMFGFESRSVSLNRLELEQLHSKLGSTDTGETSEVQNVMKNRELGR